ncbi:MAG: aldose 1-epimerase [Sulfobacillus thermosulfidooxidans]|nr:MAG: aldose 1-epimerase [Sulfobacillus thermosulfidooxidans]
MTTPLRRVAELEGHLAVEKVTHHIGDIDVISLENPYWACLIAPALGGQILSLRFKPLNWELLRVPSHQKAWEDEPFLFGIPILIPPGRIAEGQFTWNGTHYHWPQNDTAGPNHLHGFVWNRPWRVVDVSATHLWLTLGAQGTADLAWYMGSRLNVGVEYALRGPELLIRVTAQNTGSMSVPFGIGFHTTWNLQEQDWEVLIPRGREWAMTTAVMPNGTFLPHLSSLRGLPVGRLATSVVADACYRLDDDVDTAVFMRGAESAFEFIWQPDAQFRQLTIFRPSLNSPFICVEPCTWTHNAPNLSVDQAISGMSGLDSGEEKVFEYRILANAQ